MRENLMKCVLAFFSVVASYSNLSTFIFRRKDRIYIRNRCHLLPVLTKNIRPVSFSFVDSLFVIHHILCKCLSGLSFEETHQVAGVGEVEIVRQLADGLT